MKLETCHPKGRLITLCLCSLINYLSGNLGKEEVPWDGAASPQGGVSALGTFSSATSKLHPQTPSAKL